MENLLKVFFVVCFATTGIYANDPNLFHFVPHFEYKSGFQPDIFTRCWSEAGIPLAVALGELFRWPYMCSYTYYDTCKNELPQALMVVAGLTPDQRDFVMSSLLSWVNGGAPHLCSLGKDYVRGIMNNGGDTCYREIARSEIEKCNLQMIALTTGLNYSPPYCSSMDNAMECYLEAIVPCANDNLDNFLRDFFESVVWDSPCSGSSPFTNEAFSINSNSAFLAVLFTSLLSTLLFIM